LLCRYYLTTLDGTPVEPGRQTRRQRRIRRNLYNHQWAQRYLAVMSWFKGDEDQLAICGTGENQFLLEPGLISFEVGNGIDEVKLFGEREAAQTPEEEEAIALEAALLDTEGG